MATKRTDEVPEAAGVDPNAPVVDPPQATAEEATDSERPRGTERVTVTQMATLTLPSGASYALQAGESLDLLPEDADFVVNEGYGTKADEPSGE